MFLILTKTYLRNTKNYIMHIGEKGKNTMTDNAVWMENKLMLKVYLMHLIISFMTFYT